MIRGRCKAWVLDRGFGFIRPSDRGPPVFVHLSAIPGGSPLVPGELVDFEYEYDDQGRPHAVLVLRVDQGDDPRAA